MLLRVQPSSSPLKISFKKAIRVSLQNRYKDYFFVTKSIFCGFWAQKKPKVSKKKLMLTTFVSYARAGTDNRSFLLLCVNQIVFASKLYRLSSVLSMKSTNHFHEKPVLLRLSLPFVTAVFEKMKSDTTDFDKYLIFKFLFVHKKTSLKRLAFNTADVILQLAATH
ncbi:hypothetical protein P7G51_08960 [Enterococcus asini]|uniref:hypothetical protein n=1 Tax=Enterococcus TaxID=1350 RepID=UPI00288C8ABB|nr:hypothetical protein [Enterococcus asini]MDT2757505.1 hypothetical protein [Enterococcus asini]